MHGRRSLLASWRKTMPKREVPLLRANEMAFADSPLVDVARVARLVYTHPATRELKREQRDQIRRDLGFALAEARDGLRGRTCGRHVKFNAQGLDLLAASVMHAWLKAGLKPTVFDQAID